MSTHPDNITEHRVRHGGVELPMGVELLGFLGRGRLGETWLVGIPSGTAAAAKRLAAGAGDKEAEALRRLTGIREPELLPCSRSSRSAAGCG